MTDYSDIEEYRYYYEVAKQYGHAITDELTEAIAFAEVTPEVTSRDLHNYLEWWVHSIIKTERKSRPYRNAELPTRADIK